MELSISSDRDSFRIFGRVLAFISAKYAPHAGRSCSKLLRTFSSSNSVLGGLVGASVRSRARAAASVDGFFTGVFFVFVAPTLDDDLAAATFCIFDTVSRTSSADDTALLF